LRRRAEFILIAPWLPAETQTRRALPQTGGRRAGSVLQGRARRQTGGSDFQKAADFAAEFRAVSWFLKVESCVVKKLFFENIFLDIRFCKNCLFN
jgi:hypothetical protein